MRGIPEAFGKTFRHVKKTDGEPFLKLRLQPILRFFPDPVMKNNKIIDTVVPIVLAQGSRNDRKVFGIVLILS